MKNISLILPFILAILLGCGRRDADENTVIRGTFRQSFTETGELQAISASALIMPRISYQFGYEFKIVELADQGKMVGERDTVIRLDPSSVEKFIITKEEALETEYAAEKKQKVQIENTLQDLKAQLRNEQAAYDLKKLELERSRFEPENKRKIKDLEFRQATIKLGKIKRKLERQKQFDNFDLRIQRIKVQQGEADLADARAVLGQLIITSPKAGLFQLGSSPFEYPPKDFKVGDRAYPGLLIARIPDIEHMKVKTYVNEADISKISQGMPVIVRMDALPSVPFHGEITDISRVCLPREKEKVFNVVVRVKESDLRLKPGMTVSCEYLCYETEDALYVPNNCLYREGGKAYVFLKNGGSPKKVEVEAGPANSFHTLIHADLKAGEPLVPFDDVLNEKNT